MTIQRSKAKKPRRSRHVNSRRRGLVIERLAARQLQRQGFRVWRPPKVRFQSQDILTLFDVIAVSRRSLRLIQVQKERLRPYKVNGIKKLPRPKNVSCEVWVWKNKEKRFMIKFF